MLWMDLGYGPVGREASEEVGGQRGSAVLELVLRTVPQARWHIRCCRLPY